MCRSGGAGAHAPPKQMCRSGAAARSRVLRRRRRVLRACGRVLRTRGGVLRRSRRVLGRSRRVLRARGPAMGTRDSLQAIVSKAARRGRKPTLRKPVLLLCVRQPLTSRPARWASRRARLVNTRARSASRLETSASRPGKWESRPVMWESRPARWGCSTIRGGGGCHEPHAPAMQRAHPRPSVPLPLPNNPTCSQARSASSRGWWASSRGL